MLEFEILKCLLLDGLVWMYMWEYRLKWFLCEDIYGVLIYVLNLGFVCIFWGVNFFFSFNDLYL